MLLLKQYEFQLNFSKCVFLRTSIEYLGYIVSPSGITLSPRHIEAIKSFPQPRKISDLQRFLGLSNYFRKFIKDYATKVKPLTNLLKKSSPFQFDQSCVAAFEVLKHELISSPVLGVYNPHAPTEIHFTDASSIAIAGILLQKQQSTYWAPIAYYSQSLNKAEKNYHSYELEMLAVVRTIERFHIYLYGLDFTVITDCNALVCTVKKACLKPRVARWILRLQDYRFSIKHRDGRRMALSRIVCLTDTIPLEKELQYRQLIDPNIKSIAELLEHKDHDKFLLLDGLVFRKGIHRHRFVVPDTMIGTVIRIYHDDLAHCGFDKTVQGISGNYWFPAMKKRIRTYIDNCLTCMLVNTSSSREGELQLTDTPSLPFEIFHLEFIISVLLPNQLMILNMFWW